MNDFKNMNKGKRRYIKIYELETLALNQRKDL
jgi:hypothetical protein